MLGDEWTAVNADDVVFWECLAELLFCLEVRAGVAVSGHQDGSIDDEEVGVSSRKSCPVLVEDSLRHRQRDEAVRLAFQRAERL